MSEAPGEPPKSDDQRFIDETLALLETAHATRRDTALSDAFPAPRRRRLPILLIALAAAILAAVVTWAATRPSSHEPGPMSEQPFAFDGNATPHAPHAAEPDVTRDAHGRLSVIGHEVDGRPDGERLLFRSGNLIRIEHWRAGKLHGVVIDLDADGRVIATELWNDGVSVERAPR